MKFPIKKQDIIELGLEECGISALYEMFHEYFNNQFESIEFYRKESKSGSDWLDKMIFYDQQGFINRMEFYLPTGEIRKVEYFEKSESQIISKEKLEYGYTNMIWNFNAIGNLISVNNNDDFLLSYNKKQQLEKTSDGLEFKWENDNISELINTNNGSIIQKVVERNKHETIVEFVGRINKNTSGIRTYKYDELERLIRIESDSGLRLTEIEYETSKTLNKQISTSYFNQEQDSYSCITEEIIEDKVQVQFIFQQRKDSPIIKSRIVKNKRK